MAARSASDRSGYGLLAVGVCLALTIGYGALSKRNANAESIPAGPLPKLNRALALEFVESGTAQNAPDTSSFERSWGLPKPTLHVASWARFHVRMNGQPASSQRVGLFPMGFDENGKPRALLGLWHGSDYYVILPEGSAAAHRVHGGIRFVGGTVARFDLPKPGAPKRALSPSEGLPSAEVWPGTWASLRRKADGGVALSFQGTNQPGTLVGVEVLRSSYTDRELSHALRYVSIDAGDGWPTLPLHHPEDVDTVQVRLTRCVPTSFQDRLVFPGFVARERSGQVYLEPSRPTEQRLSGNVSISIESAQAPPRGGGPAGAVYLAVRTSGLQGSIRSRLLSPLSVGGRPLRILNRSGARGFPEPSANDAPAIGPDVPLGGTADVVIDLSTVRYIPHEGAVVTLTVH